MAGLLENELRLKQYVRAQEITDANNMVAGEFGYIKDASLVSNIPASAVNGYLYCVGLSNGYRIQYYIDATNNYYGCRVFIFNTWRSWLQL